MGAAPEALVGTEFMALLHPEKQGLVQELLSSMSPGTRLDPTQVQLAGMSGSALPYWELRGRFGQYFGWK